MALYPGSLINWIEQRFLKLDTGGNLVPNASGFINTFAAGTSTPLATYADANLSSANPTTVNLGSDGRPTVDMFLSATGYKFQFYDNTSTLLYTVDKVEDPGNVFASNFGTLQSAGGKNVTSGYTVLSTDRLVTVSSTGGPNPCIVNLPASSAYTGMLAIKNLGTVPLAVTPNGLDTIDTINSAFTISAASSPAFPCKLFVSTGAGAWYCLNVS